MMCPCEKFLCVADSINYTSKLIACFTVCPTVVCGAVSKEGKVMVERSVWAMCLFITKSRRFSPQCRKHRDRRPSSCTLRMCTRRELVREACRDSASMRRCCSFLEGNVQ
ncbi:unnamed protein product [Ectocarpus sp. 13 AM-2016]